MARATKDRRRQGRELGRQCRLPVPGIAAVDGQVVGLPVGRRSRRQPRQRRAGRARLAPAQWRCGELLRSRMRSTVAVLLLAVALAPSAASAHSHTKKGLEIVHPWTPATTEATTATTQVFMTIK